MSVIGEFSAAEMLLQNGHVSAVLFEIQRKHCVRLLMIPTKFPGSRMVGSMKSGTQGIQEQTIAQQFFRKLGTLRQHLPVRLTP